MKQGGEIKDRYLVLQNPKIVRNSANAFSVMAVI